jgi:hypothetical protein
MNKTTDIKSIAREISKINDQIIVAKREGHEELVSFLMKDRFDLLCTFNKLVKEDSTWKM